MLAVTSVVKNREWILPFFLNCVKNLAYPHDATSLIFLDDASTDNTLPLLERFRAEHEAEYQHILILHNTTPVAANTSSRDAQDRFPIYTHLANLRNIVLQAVRQLGCRWQLSIDSDILFVPDLLQQLGQHRLPYVSTIILNDSTMRRRFDFERLENRHVNFGNLEIIDGEEFYINMPYSLGNLYEVMVSGACYLVNQAVIESGAEFAFHHLGEDVGYCNTLRERGFRILCDTTPKAIHVMEPRFLKPARRAFRRLMTAALIGEENRLSANSTPEAVAAALARIAPPNTPTENI